MKIQHEILTLGTTSFLSFLVACGLIRALIGAPGNDAVLCAGLAYTLMRRLICEGYFNEGAAVHLL